MRVRSLMTRDPITAPADCTVRQALKIMMEHKIRHLPVVDDGVLLGMVSERDLRDECVPPLLGLAAKPFVDELLEQPLSTLVQDRILTIHDDTSVKAAIELLIRHKVGALLVMDDQDSLVGVLSYIDVLEAALELLP